MFYWASLSAHNHTGCIPSSFTALFVSERCPYRCQPLYKISRLPGLRASAWWSSSLFITLWVAGTVDWPLAVLLWPQPAAFFSRLCSFRHSLLRLLDFHTWLVQKRFQERQKGAWTSRKCRNPTLERANVFACVVRVFECVCVCVFITLLCWGCYYLLMVRFKMQHHISRWYNNASLFHPLYLSDTHTPTHTRIYAAC